MIIEAYLSLVGNTGVSHFVPIQHTASGIAILIAPLEWYTFWQWDDDVLGGMI